MEWVDCLEQSREPGRLGGILRPDKRKLARQSAELLIVVCQLRVRELRSG